jgi:hypothetical protein
MDGMHKLERGIKIMVAVISLAAICFLGLRVMIGKSFNVNPQRECAMAGRTYDTTRGTCLPR